MGTPRFTPEFNEEAARQITKRLYIQIKKYGPNSSTTKSSLMPSLRSYPWQFKWFYVFTCHETDFKAG